jgi:hypothetical protein
MTIQERCHRQTCATEKQYNVQMWCAMEATRLVSDWQLVAAAVWTRCEGSRTQWSVPLWWNHPKSDKSTPWTEFYRHFKSLADHNSWAPHSVQSRCWHHTASQLVWHLRHCWDTEQAPYRDYQLEAAYWSQGQDPALGVNMNLQQRSRSWCCRPLSDYLWVMITAGRGSHWHPPPPPPLISLNILPKRSDDSPMAEAWIRDNSSHTFMQSASCAPPLCNHSQDSLAECYPMIVEYLR